MQELILQVSLELFAIIIILSLFVVSPIFLRILRIISAIKYKLLCCIMFKFPM